MKETSHATDQSIASRTWWCIGLVMMAAAAVFGIGARFHGIGTAALAVDEFFMIRSVEQLLTYGIPRFDCGGYYVRGILFQYAVAPLLAAGVSAEAAGRVVASLCNIAAVPAVFLLARRAGGLIAAVVCVTIFLLSLWEIEFSRFARMYAPYQSLFLWYALFLLRATVDDDSRARLGVYALSLAGPLVWQGGALLAMLNFAMPLTSRYSLRLRELVTCGAILAAVAVYSGISFRFMGEIPALPADYIVSGDRLSVGRLLQANWPLLSLRTHAAAWVPFVLFLATTAWLGWRQRQTWPNDLRECLGLLIVVLLFVGGLIGLGFGLLLLWILAFADRDIDPYRLVRWLLPIICIACLFWSVLIASTATSVEAGVVKQVLVMFLKYPNVVEQVVYPWLKTLPVLTAGMTALTGLAFAIVLYFRRRPEFAALRFLMLVVLAAVLMIGAIPTTYHETRYTFFLYPLLIIIAASGVTGAGSPLDGRFTSSAAAGVIGIGVMLIFVLSNDFNPEHLRGIDEPAAIYRRDLPGPMRAHLYVRSDSPSVGEFLRTRVAPDDVVVAADVASTRYVDTVNAVYVARSSALFVASSCRSGTVERWTDLPLLSTPEQFTEFVDGSAVTWLIVPKQFTRAKIGDLADSLTTSSIFTSPDNAFDVFRLSNDGR